MKHLKTHRYFTKIGILSSLILLYACAPETNKEPAKNTRATQDTHEKTIMSETDRALLEKLKPHFKALPTQATSTATNPTTPEKVTLGKMLFYEARLSKSGAISCSSCHSLATYGVDNRPSSIGHGFQVGGRNSPTVLNADFNLAQFWDGRAADLEAQAEGPILNPIEMAMPDEASAVKRLSSIPEYISAFKQAFPEEKTALNYKNIARAIASFERTLITPAPIDAFLNGDGKALNTEAKEGAALFVDHGCIACHSGTGIGGGSYQKFGLIKPYESKDAGRFDLTKKESDRAVFKVPTLRNVTHTYPYFHDGKVWDIHEAVKIMGQTQLGKDIPDDEIKKIVAFLDSFTGKLSAESKTLPILPASTSTTPHPEI